MGQKKETLCHRCAERYGQAFFAALYSPKISFSGVVRPQYSSLPADLNPFTPIPVHRPERRRPIT